MLCKYYYTVYYYKLCVAFYFSVVFNCSAALAMRESRDEVDKHCAREHAVDASVFGRFTRGVLQTVYPRKAPVIAPWREHRTPDKANRTLIRPKGTFVRQNFAGQPQICPSWTRVTQVLVKLSAKRIRVKFLPNSGIFPKKIPRAIEQRYLTANAICRSIVPQTVKMTPVPVQNLPVSCVLSRIAVPVVPGPSVCPPVDQAARPEGRACPPNGSGCWPKNSKFCPFWPQA